jgi:hypothetical protein
MDKTLFYMRKFCTPPKAPWIKYRSIRRAFLPWYKSKRFTNILHAQFDIDMITPCIQKNIKYDIHFHFKFDPRTSIYLAIIKLILEKIFAYLVHLSM